MISGSSFGPRVVLVEPLVPAGFQRSREPLLGLFPGGGIYFRAFLKRVDSLLAVCHTGPQNGGPNGAPFVFCSAVRPFGHAALISAFSASLADRDEWKGDECEDRFEESALFSRAP